MVERSETLSEQSESNGTSSNIANAKKSAGTQRCRLKDKKMDYGYKARRMSAWNENYSREHYSHMFSRHITKNIPEGWKIESEKIYVDNGLPADNEYGHQFCPVGWKHFITKPDGTEHIIEIVWDKAIAIADDNPDMCFKIKWTEKIDIENLVLELKARFSIIEEIFKIDLGSL